MESKNEVFGISRPNALSLLTSLPTTIPKPEDFLVAASETIEVNYSIDQPGEQLCQLPLKLPINEDSNKQSAWKWVARAQNSTMQLGTCLPYITGSKMDITNSDIVETSLHSAIYVPLKKANSGQVLDISISTNYQLQ